jgi:hypothetical protein
MFITENSTATFKADWQRFTPSAQRRIRRSISIFTSGDLSARSLYRPHAIKLKNGLTSSLYVLRVDSDIRIILAVDEDPLFNRVIITLFRVVTREKLESAFDSVAKLLYRDQLT